MKRTNKINTLLHKSSAVVMILTLMWLTISTAFVFSFNQNIGRQAATNNTNIPLNGSEDETSNPFETNTEEKASGSTSLLEEYIHLQQNNHYPISITAQYHKCENSDTYIAFHGELLVPPPNVA